MVMYLVIYFCNMWYVVSVFFVFFLPRVIVNVKHKNPASQVILWTEL